MNEGEWTNTLVTVWVTSCVQVGSHFIMTRTHFSVKETETQVRIVPKAPSREASACFS